MTDVGAKLALFGVVLSLFVGFLHRRSEAKLKLQVDTKIQEVRGEIERSLKNQEVRLRVAAEFRLKMLERMLSDVADFRSKLGAFVGAVSRLTDEVEPNGVTEAAHRLMDDAHSAFQALSGAGPFMPLDLHVRAVEIGNEFRDALRDITDWANLPTREERTVRCLRTNEVLEDISARSKTLFASWQEAKFASFTSMLDQL